MNRVICQLMFRECGFFVIPILLVQLLYVLFVQDPLRYFDTVLCVLNVGLGFFLAKRPFADDGGVRAFMFSRAFNPSRLFLVRWLFGLSILAAITLTLGLLMGLGIRQSLQQGLFQNGWYPMVRFQEVQVLWTVGIAGLLSYHTTLFFVIRNRFLLKPKLGKVALWTRRLLNLIVAGYGIAAFFFLLFWGGFDLILQPPYYWFFFPYLLLVFGVPAAIQAVLIPWFGLYCYNRQEVES